MTGTDDFVFGHYEAKGRRTPVCLPIIFCVDVPGGGGQCGRYRAGAVSGDKTLALNLFCL
ncbi:MAG: hypothetical protein BHW56_01765 [Acetobacter sp. 46_36]|nr:MAG: hypothetical protein BHW56_01765 [Acetobacter sp. 46_36]